MEKWTPARPQTVSCPLCGEPAGSLCRYPSGGIYRGHYHQARRKEAIRVRDAQKAVAL